MNILEFATTGEILSLLIKLFGIVLGLLYLFFSIIMIRQVRSMQRTITIHDRGLLVFAAYTQVFFASVLVLYAFIFL